MKSASSVSAQAIAPGAALAGEGMRFFLAAYCAGLVFFGVLIA